MSLWNTLKSAIVEDDSPQAPAPAPQGAQASPGLRSVPAQTFAHSTLNQDMVVAIRKQTLSRNTAFTQLITASESLTDIIPDQTTRLKAAQKMAGGGRSSKDFVEAVQIHLNDVDTAERTFSQQLETRIASEVGGLNTQVAATESQITSGNQEIQTLTARIQALHESVGAATAKRAELMAEASRKDGELRQAQVEFKAAAEAVRQELNGQKQTILSTLG